MVIIIVSGARERNAFAVILKINYMYILTRKLNFI